MSEEQILQQTTPSAEKKSFMQKISEHKLLIFLPAALTVVAIILGYFTTFFPTVINIFSFGFNVLKHTFSSVIASGFSATGSFIVALTLPAAVIVAKKVNKPVFTKILLFVSLGFLAVQLLCAFICLILSFFNVYSSPFWTAVQGFFSGFRGSEVLSSLVFMFKNMLSGGNFLRTIAYMFNNGINAIAELLFILKNVLCGLLCLQMLKKK